MASIIRTTDAPSATRAVAFHFDDFIAQADRCVEEARTSAAEIIVRAEGEAARIRSKAAEEGRREGREEIEQIVAAQLAPTLRALHEAASQVQQKRQAWLAHWESSVLRLATAIAAKVVRRELRQQPEIRLDLVREALELAAGSPNIRLHLNPSDCKSLRSQVRALVKSMASLGEVEIKADAAVSAGGCRVETRFGTIDQQFESQLQRIEEELGEASCSTS